MSVFIEYRCLVRVRAVWVMCDSVSNGVSGDNGVKRGERGERGERGALGV